MQCFYFEVYPNGGDVGFTVGIVGEPKQKTGFAHTGVAYDHYFEEVVTKEGSCQKKEYTQSYNSAVEVLVLGIG